MSTAAAANNVPPTSYTEPPITVILTIILLIFFFTGFLSIYFCRCFVESVNNSHVQPSDNAASNARSIPGLDQKIIESFPKIVYSSVKHYRNNGLECAICISEFADEDVLRLLTLCCHVFHQDCIDLWLKSNKTCPVCRKNLESDPGDVPLKCPILSHNSQHSNGENPVPGDLVSITINDYDHNNDDELNAMRGGSDDDDARKNVEDGMFPKAHSTGHLMVRMKGKNDEDRYTLRLPEDVRSRIIRGRDTSRSCTAIEEFSDSKNLTSSSARIDGGSKDKANNV